MEDTAKPITVRKFAMGEDVPEWLLTLEPRSGKSRRENFRFAIDVDVIETEEVFVIVPRIFGSYATMLDMTGVSDCDMFAPGKPARFAAGLQDIFARGVVPAVTMVPGRFQEMPGPGPLMPPGPPMTVTHAPWWRRVWQALKAS